MTFDKTKFLIRFMEEGKEHVRRLNEGLLVLEKRPEDMDNLNAVFRTAHTIKGSSRMMKLTAISEVAHGLEDAFDAVRRQRIRPSRQLCRVLYKGVDAIDVLLDRIHRGEDLSKSPGEICDTLEKAARGEFDGTEEAIGADPEQMPVDEKTRKSDTAAMDTGPEEEPAAADTNLAWAWPAPAVGDPATVSSGEPAAAPECDIRRPETLRIDSTKLDELIKLMGEIVSSHSRFKQRLKEIDRIEQLAGAHAELASRIETEADFSNPQAARIVQSAKHLNGELKHFVSTFNEDLNIQGLLNTDLRDRSLEMRLLPLSTLFATFRRTVRNLARAAGKEIDFVVDGGETELDRKIIEQINDSLTHMIRNSIDHGIEPPGKRRAVSKPETGTIRLTARYEGGNVIIEISDDGAGIPLEKIRETAIRRGMVDEMVNSNMSEAELIDLIFMPGLSTSEMITSLSGRGVGMDVVRKNVEDLKGSIQVQTRTGKGTCFRLRLPLNIAIVRVLFLTVSGVTFTIPAGYVEEIIKAVPRDLIRVVDTRAVRLRDQMVPVIPLSRILDLPPGNSPAFRDPSNEVLVLITVMGSEKLGFIIDELVSEEDVVIRPLPDHMKHLPLVAGAVISGTNKLLTVLHIPRVMAAAKSLKKQIAGQPSDTDTAGRQKHILVVDDSISTREIEKSILESYGYAVTLANDGRDGFNKAKQFPYDLIITDIDMPELDGFSLTSKLRMDELYSDVPIIILSSMDRDEDRNKGLAAGADAYIIKGAFDQESLLDSVRVLIG